MSHEKKYQPYSYSKERNANNTPFALAFGERLMECPYDKNHKILETKATIHFLNCYRKHVKQRGEANLPSQFKICNYTQLHHVRVENFEAHLKTCSERLEILQEQRGIDESVAPKFYLEPEVPLPKPVKKECDSGKWDFDEDLPDDAAFNSDLDKDDGDEDEWVTQNPRRKYDFKLREKQMASVRQPIGLTKSEKKERMEKILENRNFRSTDDSEWA